MMNKLAIICTILLSGAMTGRLKAQARTTLFMGIANDQLNGTFNTVYGFRDNVPGATDAPSYAHGQGNTLLGANASNYTNGSNNTSLGFNAGGWFLSGSQNVFIGTNAASYFRNSDINGSTTRTLTGNCFLGYQAGTYNQADYNVFIGFQSGFTNVTGIRNVFVGSGTGFANTGGDNAFLGYQAGQTNTTGTNNTFLGSLAGQSNTSGQFNSFVGSYTGQANTTGGLNTFMGYGTGMSNTSGRVNTFVGGYAGENNTTGIQNTYVGYQAGQSTTTGNTNTILGYQAGSKLTTGNNNIIIGPKSGTAVSDGSDNVLMGYNSQAENSIFNSIAIGANSHVASSNSLILGNGVNVGIGTSAPKRKLEVVADEADISGLRLSKLTNQSPASLATDQFLTVNEEGDVVKARYQLRIDKASEWSDKVFSPTYALRSLESVEHFVRQHGHLPGVPSAGQVVKDGVNLVTMNATLLEKVEELTLYSIQLEKTNQQLLQKDKKQQREINELKRLVKVVLQKK